MASNIDEASASMDGLRLRYTSWMLHVKILHSGLHIDHFVSQAWGSLSQVD